MPNIPSPTNPRQPVDLELGRWRRIYSPHHYVYGDDAGPVARRAVRYHRPFMPAGGSALDAGCGEGQDAAFLAECGYAVTGMEFTPEGAEKSRRLLEARGLAGEVLQKDIRELDTSRRYDLVLAVNTVQFMGEDAPAALDALASVAAPGGVIGISLFARERDQPALSGTIWFLTFEELLERFRGWQCLEAAQLWQWNVATNEPQPFVTLIARKGPGASRELLHP